MYSLKRQRGITLIALIITIIVLLILAGVTIAMIVGDNGILKRSNEAKEITNLAKIKEEIDLKDAEWVLEYQAEDYYTTTAYNSENNKVKAMKEGVVEIADNEEVSYTSVQDYVFKQIDIYHRADTGEYTVRAEKKIVESNTVLEVSVKDKTSSKELTKGVIEINGKIKWDDEVSSANSSESVEEPDDDDENSVITEINNRLNSDDPEEYLISVSYNPQNTHTWRKLYATTDSPVATTETLSSVTNQKFNISEWHVLDADNGIVRLVPANYGTGTVKLKGAMGYNNGVKLLNDACSELYSDSTLGTTAKNIAIEDIESIIGSPTAPEKVDSPYDSNNSKYPVMYSNEIKSVINETEKQSGLGLSVQTTDVERSEGTSTTEKIGAITTATSIQPYNTYYSLTKTNLTSALGKKNDILCPKGTSTSYWIASRYVSAHDTICQFGIRYLTNNGLQSSYLFDSSGNVDNSTLALFPVVSVDSNNLQDNGDGTYTVVALPSNN